MQRIAPVTESWIYWFLAFQFVCQAALAIEWLGGIRLYFRAACFGASLLFLVMVPASRSEARHPARLFALSLLLFMAPGVFHVDTSILAGIAHWVLTLSIWAPLFWVDRIAVTPRTVWKMLRMLWIFQFASAVVGVLQVYYPERFAPSAEFVRDMFGVMADGLLIELTDGRQIWRPFGLSDSPGGAATAGSMIVVLGVALFLIVPRIQTKFAAVAGVLIGAFCIYICEIRSVVVITAIQVTVFLLLQIIQGHITRLAGAGIIIPLIIAAGFSWTLMVGGERVQKRIQSLGEKSASATYYENRGRFVEDSIVNDLPNYPLGAGLGRYGMMFRYFGDQRMKEAKPVWAEVQLSAWVFDAGIMGVLMGYAAILAATYAAIRIALNKRSSMLLKQLGTIVAALDVGWIALTFTYPMFIGQNGLVFWLLNAAIYTAAIAEERAPLIHRRPSKRSSAAGNGEHGKSPTVPRR